MSPIKIKEMSTIERLKTMELLWDSLILEEGEIKSPAWHGDILKERKSRYAAGKSKTVSLSRLKSSLRK